MNLSLNVVISELAETRRRPDRFLHILSVKRWKAFLHYQRFGLTIGQHWGESKDTGNIMRRGYSSYGDYLELQKSKLERLDLANYDVKFREALRDRLKELDFIRPGVSVLCLAARIGTEVRAFDDVNCFAVGIDLNPGENNQHVIYGDFHNLRFPDGTVDVVYSNSIDHVFDLGRWLGEVKRVLSSKGILIVEAVHGVDFGDEPDFYASLWWSNLDDVISQFKGCGFHIFRRTPFIYPWKGDQMCFSKEERPGLMSA